MGRVQDKVAVVTGAANGLGRSMAQRLAEEGMVSRTGDGPPVTPIALTARMR